MRLSSFSLVITSTLKLGIYWLFFFLEERIMLTSNPGGLWKAGEEGQTLLANSFPFILYIGLGFG